jgi:hypothetical protein
MMDIMPGEFEALSLVALAIAGLAIGGVLAFSFLMVSIFVRRDKSPGILKGWAIAAAIIFVINVFAYGWLSEIGRQNVARDGQQQPLIQPPQLLVNSLSLMNVLAPTVGVMSPIVLFWVKHSPRSRHSPRQD